MRSVVTPVRSISGVPRTETGIAVDPAAIGINVPVTTNFSSVIFSSVLAAGPGVGAAVVCATTAESAPAPRKRQSAAVNFRDRMFIVVCGL